MKRFILITAAAVLVFASVAFAYILNGINNDDTDKELQDQLNKEMESNMLSEDELAEILEQYEDESSLDETEEQSFLDMRRDYAADILLYGGWTPEDGTIWVNEYVGEYTAESAQTEEGMVSILFREDKSLAQKDILRDGVIISEMYDTNAVMRRKESMFNDGTIEQINYNERGKMLEYRLGDAETDQHICYHADGTLISKQIVSSQTIESFTYHSNNSVQYHYVQNPHRTLHEFFDKSGRLTDIHCTEGNVFYKTQYNEDGSYKTETTYEDNTVWAERFDSAGNSISREQIK